MVRTPPAARVMAFAALLAALSLASASGQDKQAKIAEQFAVWRVTLALVKGEILLNQACFDGVDALFQAADPLLQREIFSSECGGGRHGSFKYPNK